MLYEVQELNTMQINEILKPESEPGYKNLTTTSTVSKIIRTLSLDNNNVKILIKQLKKYFWLNIQKIYFFQLIEICKFLYEYSPRIKHDAN